MLIGVTEYQEIWPQQFRQAAATIRATLGDYADRIDHIGSTAVPGLAAKPVIDLQVTVSDLTHISRIAGALEGMGFVHRPDAANDRPPPWETTDPEEWNKEFFELAMAKPLVFMFTFVSRAVETSGTRFSFETTCVQIGERVRRTGFTRGC